MAIDDEIMRFDDFLKSKGISPDDERVPLLKEVWNQGVESACEWVGISESTDFGAEKALKIS